MLYETDANRKSEADVLSTISAKYNCEVEKCSHLSPVDAFLLNGDGSHGAVVEVKVRRNEHTRYPTYMLSYTKYKSIVAISEAENIPPLLIVRFTDGLYATKLTGNYDIKEGGRRDRNNPNDIETCVFIPMQEFIAI